MSDIEQQSATSFLEWIQDESDFELFVDEIAALKRFMESNRAGRAVLAMLQVRLAQVQLAAKNESGRKGIIRAEDLPAMNYTNGYNDGRAEELAVLISPGFGLKDIILANEDALRESWIAREKSLKAEEPQNQRKGE